MPSHRVPTNPEWGSPRAPHTANDAQPATRKNTSDIAQEPLVARAERQKLISAGQQLVSRLELERRAASPPNHTVTVGASENVARSLLDGSDDDGNPDLAWGAGACALEMYGADTPKNRKRVFNWRADVRAARREKQVTSYPNPGFVFFSDRNAVVLCRRAFRAYVARLLKGGR